MGMQVIEERSEFAQVVAPFTGNGGYNSSPNDNCNSLHLIHLDEMCSESYPSTILEALSALES